MAGSYQHVVEEDGSLRSAERIGEMLECYSGDMAEAVEEMYGMIWYLAGQVEAYFGESRWTHDEGPSHWVKEAQEKYVEGLRLSPSKRGVLWDGS